MKKAFVTQVLKTLPSLLLLLAGTAIFFACLQNVMVSIEPLVASIKSVLPSAGIRFIPRN